MALKQVEDHRFQIGGLDVGFPPSPAISAKIVDHKINGLIIAFGTIDGVQPVLDIFQRHMMTTISVQNGYPSTEIIMANGAAINVYEKPVDIANWTPRRSGES